MPIGMIPKKIPWTRQPPAGTPINPAWARGMVYAKNFSDMAAPELLDNVNPTIVDFLQTSGYMEATGLGGDYFDANVQFPISGSAITTCSALMVIRTTDTSGTIYSMRDSGDVVMQFFVNASDVQQRQASASVALDAATTELIDGDWHVLGHSGEVGTGATSACFIDGKIGSAGFASTTNAGSTSSINLALAIRWNVRPTTSFELDADFRLFIFWHDRKLTESEQIQLGHNPWQIFEPRTVWIPVGTDVAAADPFIQSDWITPRAILIQQPQQMGKSIALTEEKFLSRAHIQQLIRY